MKTSEGEKIKKDLKKINDQIKSGTLTELEIVNAIAKSTKNLKKLTKALEKATD
jgi:hypothetical protein